ncbi:MAG: YhdP family protein [Pseudomonadota bacterium]
MARSLLWLINKLWLIVAILLVLAAVLMSALRYALPHIPDVSAQLEQQIEQRLQQPIAIEQLAMSWHRQGPAVDVSNIRLIEQPNSPVQVDVEQISVVLDFWQSILQRQFIAQEFILNDAKIDIDLRKFEQQDGNTVNLQTLENLFLQQLERFSLTESELNVVNLAGNKRSVIIERLSWANQGASHQGVGKFRVRDFTRNSLDFIVKLEGNELSTIDGQFYVDSRQVDISPWLEQLAGNIDIQESNVNFTSWLSLVDGEIAEGYLQLRDNRITAEIDGRPLSVHIPEGKVSVEPRQNGWLLNVQPITAELNQQTLQLPLVAWQSSGNEHILSSDNVPLHDFLPILSLVEPGLATAVNRQQRAETEANVDVRLDSSPQQWRWLVATDDLQSAGSGSQPSWSPISVTAAGDKNGGWWRVNADSLSLSSPALSASQAWKAEAVDFSGSWQVNAESWRAQLADGQVTFNDLLLTVNGELRGEQDKPLAIALHSYSDGPFDVSTARQLLPELMGSGLKNYLTGALQDGQVRGLEVLWRGPANQFPGPSMDGVFNARVDFEPLDYQFQANWPALTKTPLRLDFYQHSLSMHTDAGAIKGADIKQVNAQIPDLTDAQRGLQVSSRVTAEPDQLQSVFDSSPLTSVSETLRQVQPQNTVVGDFTLDIPLDNSRNVGVTVDAALDGQDIYIAALDQSFNVSAGRLRIDNDKVVTEDLSLSWYGQPITTKVLGETQDGDYLLSVETAIDWQLEPLLNELPMQGWQRYFYGAVNGSGELKLRFADDIEANWQSQYDLTGLESNLPVPLAKDFGENWQLNLDIEGDNDQLAMELAVDERLHWQSRWRAGEPGWQQANLLIGEPPTEQQPLQSPAANNFLISGHVPYINVAEWYDLIYFLQQDVQAQQSTTESPAATLPDAIFVTTPELNWAGQQFEEAEVSVVPESGGWNGRVYANDLAVEVEIPDNFIEQPIQVDADFIQLSSDLDLSAKNNLRDTETKWQWVTRIPAINLSCKTCKLDDKSFVDVEASLTPIDGGIQLDQLTAQSNNSELATSGYWLVTEGAPYSQFSGSLNSDDIGDLLRQYGLETAIRDSSAAIDFGLHWNGHPHQFDVNTLGGSLQWDFGQGYLAEVSDGGARLFSLLSLDGILRKLTLDFRDIFSQGMFYTDLTGSVQLADGVATTEDTKLLGSAGNMEIVGTTNLVDETLDYELTYAPKVTSSLPVILAWMVNPPSGLAALLIDKVLQDAEVISQLRYKVSGTIGQPEVTEVERDSRPVDIPDVDEGQEDANDEDTTNGNST